MSRTLPRLLPTDPPQLVVHDRGEECPYLPDLTARMPIRLPLRELSPRETDRALAAGDRRHGRFLYRTACPSCSACEPIRLDLAAFEPSRNLRRVLRRGDRELEVEIGPPTVDRRRVELFEAHKRGRGLARPGMPDLTLEAYARFLVERCCDAFELAYRRDGELVGVAVTDRGERALSAVYTFFDPEHAKLSIGTYSILKQAELGRRKGMDWLYLGYYVAENRHMRYKARFVPHERRIGGEWRRFEDAPASTG